jgi:hypothetical protein
MKFLVDECLSPELTKLAHNRGYGESLPLLQSTPLIVIGYRGAEASIMSLLGSSDLAFRRGSIGAIAAARYTPMSPPFSKG